VVEFQPDLNKVVQVMLDTGAGPLVLEEANVLIEKWIAERVCFDKQIVAVEQGFSYWLDNNTVIIGVQDLLTIEDGEIVGGEWKTTKGTTRYWDEAKWVESISSSPQCAIYALITPTIRVRAVTKSDPPEIWGREVLTFSEARLTSVRNALLNQAAAIRAMRRSGAMPWALPGLHCTNMFRRECAYLNECKRQQYPATAGVFDLDNPAAKLVLPQLGDCIKDPELVILSASSYNDAMQCAELYRRNLAENKESSRDLDVGSVFHTACANIYTQLKEFQNGNNESSIG
jgi:hypothetical protein